MIGWRPILVSIIAVALFAVAALHIPGPDSDPPCATADALRKQGLLIPAREGYVELLKSASPPSCADEGLDTLTKAQCARAAALVEPSPKSATKAYTAIAIAEPIREAAQCARRGLSALAAAKEGAAN